MYLRRMDKINFLPPTSPTPHILPTSPSPCPVQWQLLPFSLGSSQYVSTRELRGSRVGMAIPQDTQLVSGECPWQAGAGHIWLTL